MDILTIQLIWELPEENCTPLDSPNRLQGESLNDWNFRLRCIPTQGKHFAWRDARDRLLFTLQGLLRAERAARQPVQ